MVDGGAFLLPNFQIALDLAELGLGVDGPDVRVFVEGGSDDEGLHPIL